MEIKAEVIADSIANGIRLTTLCLSYPRFIHSEFMTHRMFSRNASSSRAIPIKKMLEQVKNSPAMPVHWGKNQPGMQAREELDDTEKVLARHEWRMAARYAMDKATWMTTYGVHKQVVNRLLEPFQYIKVIVTATEWDNFFKLRLQPDAQPEIAFLASKMQKAMDESTPVELEHGEWHLPYVQSEDCLKTTTDNFAKLSVARCARVSYLNHDSSSPDVEKDISLADRLLKDGHLSPLEHIATPMTKTWDTFNNSMNNYLEKGITHVDRNGNFYSGNFKGWLQYRQIV